MKKVLIAVDDTTGSKGAFEAACKICSAITPETSILLYVEKLEGRSLIDEMLGVAEMSTLKEVLEGTEFKAILDEKAKKILNYYKKAIEDRGISGVETLIKGGHPADEILRTAAEEEVDMIVIGARGKRASHLFMGSVSREVANRADVPVLLVK